MQQFNHQPTSLIVLKKGEELMTSLETYASEHSLKSAWINVIGGAAKVTLGYYDHEAREYIWNELAEPLEIVGLQGNLVELDGKPYWHIHGTFSRADFSVIGGHVKNCEIGLTGEVALTPIDAPVTRQYDEETGLKLICPLTKR